MYVCIYVEKLMSFITENNVDTVRFMFLIFNIVTETWANDVSRNLDQNESDHPMPTLCLMIIVMMCIIAVYRLVSCSFRPFALLGYNRNGWLGVKHQVTYLVVPARPCVLWTLPHPYTLLARVVPSIPYPLSPPHPPIRPPSPSAPFSIRETFAWSEFI